jgi:hypothetical protein
MAIELTDKITPKNAAFTDIVDAKNVGGDSTSSNALQADVVANNAANKVLRVHSGNSYVEAATLTAGTNVTITHGTGTITIDASGGGGTGNVVGPSSSTIGALAVWNNSTGTLLTGYSSTLNSTGYLNLGSSGRVDSNFGYFGLGGGTLSAAGGFTISNGTGFTMTGSTSGVITIQPGAANAGSWTWKLPTSMPGAADYFLKTSGTTGETAWATISGVSVTVTTKKVATDQTYTSNTTLTKITSLDFSASASKTYFVHGSLAVQQLGGAADFKYAFDIPTGATMSLKVTNLAEGGAVRLSKYITTGSISPVEVDNGAYNSIHPTGLVFVTISGWITMSTTAGTISFYASQNTSSASSTTVYSGSSITYTESL